MVRKKFKHRRQIEEKNRRIEKFTFHSIKKITRYRRKDGRLAKKGTRGARAFREQRLLVESADGKIKEYGSIRERNKSPLIRFSTWEESRIREGLSIKGLLEDRDIIPRLKREKARGIEITIRGRAIGKERRLTTRIIFNRKEMAERGKLMKLIVGKVQAFIKSHGLRLSHHSISPAKKAKQLKRVTFSINIFY